MGAGGLSGRYGGAALDHTTVTGANVGTVEFCKVYWDSQACYLSPGHEGPHVCNPECAAIPPEDGGAGRPPYYGPETRFYGEDAESLGLPLVTD